MTAKPLVLDRAAVTVNLGILITLLTAVGGGAVYLTTFDNRLVSVQESMQEVRKAIDRNTEQMLRDGKALAILQTIVSAIDKRVVLLEAKISK